MPEQMNLEIAHKLAEPDADAKKSLQGDLIEITEGSCFRCSGNCLERIPRQAFLYGDSSKLRVVTGRNRRRQHLLSHLPGGHVAACGRGSCCHGAKAGRSHLVRSSGSLCPSSSAKL